MSNIYTKQTNIIIFRKFLLTKRQNSDLIYVTEKPFIKDSDGNLVLFLRLQRVGGWCEPMQSSGQSSSRVGLVKAICE